MLELNKLTWIGGTIGLFIIFMSTIKWFFIEVYVSKLIFGIGLGCSILCFSYFYECLKLRDKDSEHNRRRLDELEFWARERGYTYEF
jgi:hypothetical protein